MKRRTILVLSGLTLCVLLVVCIRYAVRSWNSDTPAAPKDTDSSLDMQEQVEDNTIDFEADGSQKSGTVSDLNDTKNDTVSDLNDTGSTSGTDNADHASGMENNTPGKGNADNGTGMGSTPGSGTDGLEDVGSKGETENPGNAGSTEKKKEWTEYYP